MRRRAAPDPLSADPSCPAPDIDRFSSTESRFQTSINRVLQHNLPDSGHSSVQVGRPLSASSRHRPGICGLDCGETASCSSAYLIGRFEGVSLLSWIHMTGAKNRGRGSKCLATSKTPNDSPAAGLTCNVSCGSNCDLLIRDDSDCMAGIV